MEAQVKALVSKTSTWERKIKFSSLSPTEVFISFNSGIQMSVRYVLPVTRMNTQQCNTIDTPMIRGLLHAHSTTSKFPRAVLFGSTHYGGLGISSTEMHQLTEGLSLFIGHLRLQDTTGNLGIINLQQLQLEVGTNMFCLTKDPTVWSFYSTPSLIHFWWRAMWEHRIYITGTQSWVPTSMQIDEMSIMDIIVPQCTKDEVVKINAVRLYLQVYYPSEVMEIRGNRVLQHYREGQRTNERGQTTLIYPNQRKPAKSWLEVWNKAMDLVEAELQDVELEWATTTIFSMEMVDKQH